MWLEETLKHFKRILLLISHSQASYKPRLRGSARIHVDLVAQLGLMQLAPVVGHACSGTVRAMTICIASKLS